MKENTIRPADFLNKYLDLCRKDLEALLSDKSRFHSVPCPGCGNKEGLQAFVKWGHAYEECPNCRSFYMNPRPTQPQLSRFYAEGAASEFWAREYYPRVIGPRRVPVYRQRAEWLKAAATQARLALRSILDVGCGFGVFLQELKICLPGASISGLEPSAAFAREAVKSGVKVYEHWLEDPKVPEIIGRYDCITLFEVWEHLHTISVALKRIRSLLNSCGVMFFTTLCRDGFDIELLQGEHNNIYPPCHINILSREGFRQVLNRSGFRILRELSPGRLDVDIARKALIGTHEHDGFLEKFLRSGSETALADFQDFLARHGLSSHYWILAQRKED